MTQQDINANLLRNIERFVDAIANHKDFLDTIQPIASDVLDLYKLKTAPIEIPIVIPIEIGIFSHGARFPSDDNPKDDEKTVYYPAELLLYPIDGMDDSTLTLRVKNHTSHQHEILSIKSGTTEMKWNQVCTSFKTSDSNPLKLFACILNDGQDLCIKGISRCYLTFKNKVDRQWLEYLREKD